MVFDQRCLSLNSAPKGSHAHYVVGDFSSGEADMENVLFSEALCFYNVSGRALAQTISAF